MIGVCDGQAFRAETIHAFGSLMEHVAAVEALAHVAHWPMAQIREALASPRRVVVVVELGDGSALADVAHDGETDRAVVARLLGAARG